MASQPALPIEARRSKPMSARKAQSMARPSLPEWIVGERSRDKDAPKLSFRTVFISDLHLGTPGCNAEMLLDFLKSIKCETLYLVGDIVDGLAV